MGRERTDYNLARARIIAKVGARSFDVLSFLIKHARDDEALVTATEIANAMNFSRVSAHKHLRRLADADLITTCEWVTREDGSRCVSRRVDLEKVGGLHGGLHYVLNTNLRTRESSSGLSPRYRAGKIGDTEELMTDFSDVIDSLNLTPPTRHDVDLLVLPPYPSPSVCPLVRYPSQPMLPSDKPAAVKMMLRAYRGVVRRHYGVTPRVDLKARFRIEKVLTSFRRHKIDNAWAWCAYRITHWLEHNSAPSEDGDASSLGKKQPPVDWILNSPAVEKFAAAFRATSARYEHLGKVQMTPAHKELLGRWSALFATSRKIGGEDSLRLAKERARVLPAATYNNLRDQSEHQRGAIEARLYADLAKGKWIW